MKKETIFISYAHEDKNDAQRLYKDLSALNVNLWLDSECLLPGQDWKNAIEDAIRNSDFFIAILSSKSVNKRGYVQKELKIALDVLGEIPTNEIYIIPVRIDDCEIKEPRLKPFHYVDLFIEWNDGIGMIKKSINFQNNREEVADVQIEEKNHCENSRINVDNNNELIDYRIMEKEIRENDTAKDVFKLIKKLGYVR